MNVRTSTKNILNKQIKNVKLFLCKFSTMFSKVVSEAMHSSEKSKATTPIILNIPHYIKHR